MKIYFGFTLAGDPSGLVAARKIVDVLQGMGHEVLTAHLLGKDAWEAERRITPSDVCRRDTNWLSGRDKFLAEVSGSSFGLGFETGYHLGATKKRVVLFYQRDVEQKISLLITGTIHTNCRLVPYSRIEELDALVRNSLSGCST